MSGAKWRKVAQSGAKWRIVAEWRRGLESDGVPEVVESGGVSGGKWRSGGVSGGEWWRVTEYLKVVESGGVSGGK